LPIAMNLEHDGRFKNPGIKLLVLLAAAVNSPLFAAELDIDEICNTGFYRLAYHLYQMQITATTFGSSTDSAMMGGAECLDAMGSSDQAIREYLLLTSHHPESPLDGKASLGTALCAFHLDDKNTAATWARRALSRAIEREVTDEATFLDAELDFEKGQNDSGVKHYKSLAHKMPKGLKQQLSAYTAGWLYLRAGDYSLARLYLLQASLGDDPRISAIALAGLERARWQLGEKDAAVESASLMGELYPHLRYLSLYRQGVLSLVMGREQTAAQSLEEASGDKEGMIPADKALFLAAVTNIKLGDEKQALSDLGELISNYPASPFLTAAHWQTGVLLYQSGKYSSALMHFTDLAGSAGDDQLIVNARYYKGLCLRQLHRASAARAEFLAVSPLLAPDDPCREAASYMCGEMAFEASRFDLALDDYSRYLSETSFRQYRDLASLGSGESLLKLGKNKEALAVLTNFPTDFPSSSLVPRSFLLLGQTLENLKRTTEAQSCYLSLIDKYPRSRSAAQARLQLADLYFEQGNLDAARQLYSEFLTQFPTHESADRAFYGICRSDYSLRRYEDSLTGYEQFIIKYPNSVYLDDARYGIELTLMHLGHYSNPIEATQAFLAKYPTSHLAPELIYWIAQYRQQNHEYGEAERQYLAIITNFPGNVTTVRARIAYGTLLRDSARLGEAVEQFNAAVVDKNAGMLAAEALYQAADVYMQLNKQNEAISCLSQASRNYTGSPYAPRAQLRLGGIYNQLGMKAEAKVSYTDLIDRFPNSAESDYAWLYIGLVLIDQGNYMESIGYFEHAALSSNQDVAAAALYNQALAYRLAGKAGDYERIMTELSSRFPSLMNKYEGGK
jgi:TolA-binding protein